MHPVQRRICQFRCQECCDYERFSDACDPLHTKREVTDWPDCCKWISALLSNSSSTYPALTPDCSEERAARLALLRNHAEIGHSSSTTLRIPTPRKGGKRHHHSAHGANQVFSAVTQESFDSESPDGLKRFKPKVKDSPEYIHNSPSFVSFFHTSLSHPPDQFYALFGAVHTSL